MEKDKMSKIGKTLASLLIAGASFLPLTGCKNHTSESTTRPTPRMALSNYDAGSGVAPFVIVDEDNDGIIDYLAEYNFHGSTTPMRVIAIKEKGYKPHLPSFIGSGNEPVMTGEMQMYAKQAMSAETGLAHRLQEINQK